MGSKPPWFAQRPGATAGDGDALPTGRPVRGRVASWASALAFVAASVWFWHGYTGDAIDFVRDRFGDSPAEPEVRLWQEQTTIRLFGEYPTLFAKETSFERGTITPPAGGTAIEVLDFPGRSISNATRQPRVIALLHGTASVTGIAKVGTLNEPPDDSLPDHYGVSKCGTIQGDFRDPGSPDSVVALPPELLCVVPWSTVSRAD